MCYEEEIKRLERATMLLEAGAEERASLQSKVFAYANDFLKSREDEPPFFASNGNNLSLYDSPITEGPMDPGTNLLFRTATIVNFLPSGHAAPRILACWRQIPKA